MVNSESSIFGKLLRSQIAENPILGASLCHLSCRDIANKILAENAIDSNWYDIWSTIGKNAIGLYSGRGVIGAVGCTSPAEASIGSADFARLMLDKLAATIQDNDLGVFGPAMPIKERNLRIYSDLAAQFVGCWAQLKGYKTLKEELFRPYFEISTITLPSSTDAKTLLQETLQGRRQSIATYSVLSIQGAQNDQIFTVGVNALNGLTSEGIGRSKKDAEKMAARSFIATHLTGLQYPIGMQLRINFDVQSAAKLLKIPTAPKVTQLADELNLSFWARNLLALAFVHRSYPLGGQVGPFGNNNRLLAFVGSSVIKLIISQSIFDTLSPSEIVARGGIAILLGRVGSERGMTNLTENLGSRGLRILHGPGQGHIHTTSAIQVEMFQAVIGAIYFFCEGSRTHFLDVFQKINFIYEPIQKVVAEIPFERSEVLPSKSRLQELFQAIGVRVAYETALENDGNTQTMTAKMRLTSAHNFEAIQISLKPSTWSGHQGKKKIAEEGRLASFVLGVVGKVLGISLPAASPELENQRIASWILNHTLSSIEDALTSGNDKFIDRVTELQLFGLGSLTRQNYVEFETWYLLATKTLGRDTFPDAVLHEIYSRTSQAKKVGHSQLLVQLPRIERFIRDLDPLQKYVELEQSAVYQGILAAATGFRLLSGEVVESKVSDLVLEVGLLFRGKGLTLTGTTENPTTFLEVRGSLLILVDMLMKCVRLFTDQYEIDISTSDTNLEFTLIKTFGVSENLRSDLESNPLWEVLGTLLPIIKIRESTEYLIVSMSNVLNPTRGRPALNAWLLYYLGQSLELTTNATIASLLHDLKNELLAYSTAATRAVEASSKGLRYRLAADASNHCEEALNKTLSLKALFLSSVSVTMNPTSVSGFFRALTSDLLSWLPEGISLSLPIDASTDLFSTDQAKLRSILNNLARNAVKAMSDHGILSISYIYDKTIDALEVEVRDTGPGMSQDQLLLLQLGNTLASTTRQGPGIGLLTVLLTIKELRGEVKFSNHQIKGLVVGVSLPSISQDVDIDDSMYIKSNIDERVILDEDTMGR